MLQPAMMLATHYLKIGEKLKALNLAQKIQGSEPNNPEVLDMLAQIQSNSGDKSAALETYYKLVAINPYSAFAQFRLASILMEMQNQTGASEALKKALVLQPDYIDAQMALAELEVAKRNYDQALVIARTIQRQSAESPLGLMLEGDVLTAQKNPALAVKAYERAFAIGKSGPLMIKLHTSLSQAGKGDEATARLTLWLKAHPDDEPTRLYLAETYLAEKQNKAAIEQFQTILQHNPNNSAALNNLAWTYHLEKDPRALEYADKANLLVPNSPQIMDTLGWILIEQNNITRGLPLLQQASSIDPDAVAIRYHLALGLIKSGDKANARKELERIVSSGKTLPEIDEARALLKQL
jgi:putative PEP-CTERM system TPR-repeat lipoprotein